jgi:UV DNA damage repair endonuclease
MRLGSAVKVLGGRGMDFDVMLEAKTKDLALLRLREQLADRIGGRT